LIGGAIYVNAVIVPTTPALFVPTVTPTLSPESFVNQAEEYFRTGKLNQAVTAYQDAIQTDPGNAANYIALARLQVWTGKYEDAVLNAQNALLKNPNNAMAHAVQGWALGYLGKDAEARQEVKTALEIDPNLALAQAYYAEILLNQENPDLENAVEASRKAQELDNSLLETHRIRGIVLLNTQNFEQAIDEFKAALAINKNIADINLYLGITYKAAEKFDLAEESLLAAYTLNPQDTIGLTELSRAYFSDGRFAQAAQYAEEATRVAPEDPRLHGNLGVTYYKMAEYAKAITALQLAVQGGATADGVIVEGLPLDYGRVEEYYWYLGFALAKSNRCLEAVPIFQALLVGVPNDEIAVYNATEGISACQQALGELPSPQATPVDEAAVGEATAVPAPEETPTEGN
jgi:tetratricopeptide (TPR) repeat protein